MSRLIRLYPARWRERYGDELEQLVHDLRPTTSRMAIAMDLVKGAIGAHLHAALDGLKRHGRPIGRGALLTGIVWLALSVEILLSNVVFPAKDDNSVEILASYLCVFGAPCGIGVLAARAGAARKAQATAGAVAGAAIGALTIVSFAVVDNIWLSVVSQQPQKIDGFAHSGEASMRAYINHGLIGPAIFAVVAFAVIGAVMAAVGGTVVGRPVAPSKTTAPQRPQA